MQNANLRLKPLLLVVGLSFSTPFVVQAEDFPEPTEVEKGFSDSAGLGEVDKSVTEIDRLKWGGSILSEFNYLQLGRGKGGTGAFRQPNSFWLYADSRLREDVRVFTRGKLIYDPTRPIVGVGAAARVNTDLEELKLFWNAKNSIFFTVGKQKIKWGSNRFWNPTDFLNNERRNFLYNDDLRSGIPLVKTHLPLGSANLYAVQGVENSLNLKAIKHAARLEVPVLTSEWAVTALAQDTQRPWWGLDGSVAVWNFDVTAEFAYNSAISHQKFDNFGAIIDGRPSSKSAALGVAYEQPYSDADSVVLGVEYFYQNQGYRSVKPYPFVLASGNYVPFFLSEKYGLLSIYLPKPGSLNDVSFNFLQFANLTDQSFLSRLETSFHYFQDLNFSVGLGYHFGDSNGEFKYGNQFADLSLRAGATF